jgi:hypothetical protein
MANRFSEEYKIDIWSDPYGSTVEQFMPYLDMYGYESIDFIIDGCIKGATGGAGYGATDVQVITCRLLQASNSTGGGATAISSATAVITKDTTDITTALKAKSLVLMFSTYKSSAAAAATFVVNTVHYTLATAGAAATIVQCVTAGAASVVSEAFKTAFDLGNTAWTASTQAGSPRIYIRPKNSTSVGDTVYVSAGGSPAVINPGVPNIGAHIGMRAEHMKDGCRYITLGSKSTLLATPISVTVLRKRIESPITQTNQDIVISKLLGSTSV